MSTLNFFLVDETYVRSLQDAESQKRGFSRVPNMQYAPSRKPKFLCGTVLHIHDMSYYVPVSSFKEQRPDNFLILADNGKVTSSLRFNYMFPVPDHMVTLRIIKDEPDAAYRNLLFQELRYCIKNRQTIQQLAERTYKRVLLGKNPTLVENSCDFALLEQECQKHTLQQRQEDCISTDQKHSVKELLAQAQAEAKKREQQRTDAAAKVKNPVK